MCVFAPPPLWLLLAGCRIVKLVRAIRKGWLKVGPKEDAEDKSKVRESEGE